MEPTGMSWFPVAHRLADAGVAVIRVKGQRVRALRLSLRARQDRPCRCPCARGHAAVRRASFDPFHIPAPKSHALQRLTKQRGRYQDAVARRYAASGRSRAGPRQALRPCCPSSRTRLSLALLRIGSTQALSARRSTLTRFIARSASGNHPHSGPFVETLVDGLKRAARDALALHGDHIDFAELQAEVAFEVDIVVHHLDAITGARAPHRRALRRNNDPSDALRTIPDIGPHLAPVLIGVLQTPERFRSERHIRGFCGLFPTGLTRRRPAARPEDQPIRQ